MLFRWGQFYNLLSAVYLRSPHYEEPIAAKILLFFAFIPLRDNSLCLVYVD
jgi:hypothetical protein